MVSVLSGIFCGLPTGYGLAFTCDGPDCNLVGNLSTLTCSTANGVLNCNNGKNCSGTNFTDTFVLRSDNGQLSASDLFDVGGRQASLVSNYTAAASNSSSMNTTSVESAPSATASRSSACRTQPKLSLLTALCFWLLLTLLLPSVTAATYSEERHAEVDMQNSTDVLLFPRANGAREAFKLSTHAETIVKLAADVVLAEAKDQHERHDPAQLTTEIFDTLRNSLLPTEVNIGIDLAEGRPEDAAKDATKEVAERLLDLALVGLVPETGGASLLLMLATHVAVDIAVDELFKGAHLLTEFPANSTEGHFTTSNTTVTTTDQSGSIDLACNTPAYASSPWFFRYNQFGTDDWRECKSCCVEWGKQISPQTGSCGCCTLQVQYDDPSLNCCPGSYFDVCCAVNCPRGS